MRSLIFAAVLLASPIPGGASAQNPRDDWRHGAIDIERRLDHSLAEAPLTGEERARIYEVVDVPSQFHGHTPEDERKIVLSARVGFVVLSESRAMILVRSPLLYCGGAGGNCQFWLFERQHGSLKLVLATEGNGFIARDSVHHGVHDLAVAFHVGSGETSFTVYRWSGSAYEPSDCYLAKSDSANPKSPPALRDCPVIPQ